MADTDEKIQDGENSPTLEESVIVEEVPGIGSLLIDETVPDTNAELSPEVVEKTSLLTEDISSGEEKKEELIQESVITENNSYGNKLVTIKKEDSKIEEKKDVQIKDESIIEEEKPLGDLFVNYDSEFHKNEKTIIQRIRQFKMTPKTSISFVLIIIVITIMGIGIMMKIDPKNHSIDNYKANILALVGIKTEVKVITGTLVGVNTDVLLINTGVTNTGLVDTITNSGELTDSGTGLTNTGSIEESEEMLVKEKWLTIKPDVITNPDGTTSYLYNGKVYSKDELQEQLKKEVKMEINKKTKDYLNKVYIHQ